MVVHERNPLQRQHKTLHLFPDSPSQAGTAAHQKGEAWGWRSFLLPAFPEIFNVEFSSLLIQLYLWGHLVQFCVWENIVTIVNLFNVVLAMKVVWDQEIVNTWVWLVSTAICFCWPDGQIWCSLSRKYDKVPSCRSAQSHWGRSYGGKLGVHILALEEMF
jgi:hypothetical protein